MKIVLRALRAEANRVERVIIESVDLSLYLAHAVIGGEECVIAEDGGALLKTANLLDMKRRLREVVDCDFVLRHRSAYDEMVGHDYAAHSNTMELPLGKQPLPDWLN